MKEKGDPCVLVEYSTQSKGYLIYNKRTRLIVESIHIRFDEIKEMSETSVANDTSGLVSQRQKRQIMTTLTPFPNYKMFLLQQMHMFHHNKSWIFYLVLSQKNKGSFEAESIVRAALTRVQFCLSTTPFCSGVQAVYKMSRNVMTVGSTMRISLLYRGEYSQWRERFMNYLEEQTDGEAMINSIQNGDQPLLVIAQVSLAGNAQNAPPTFKDPKFWTAE
nr:hypothetical protein [Tanacetum cinerariifolium]